MLEPCKQSSKLKKRIMLKTCKQSKRPGYMFETLQIAIHLAVSIELTVASSS